MRVFLALILLTFSTITEAQSPSLTPSQMAIMITNSVNALSMRIDALEQQNNQLQKQIADLTKERDVLKKERDDLNAKLAEKSKE